MKKVKSSIMARRKSLLHLALLSVVFSLGLAIAPNFSTLVQAQSQPEKQPTGESLRDAVRINFEPPPDQGAPSDSGGGATRHGTPDDSKGIGTRRTCFQDANKPGYDLTLLIPPTGSTSLSVSPELIVRGGLTVKDYPTFFVYVPQTSAQTAEFVLFNENGTSVLYQKIFALKGTPGIISFQLPADAPPLAIGKNYRWSFSMICDPQDRGADSFRYGWVKRIEPLPELVKDLQKAAPLERASLYAKNGIWYDTLTTIAELRLSKSDNLNISATWEELLKLDSVKLGEIAKEQMIECCKAEN